MAIQPLFKSYAGTLGGSPIAYNVQNDLEGNTADYVIVIPGGTGDGVVVTIGTVTIPVPLGVGLTIPGPVSSISLGAGTNTYVIWAGVGVAPSFFLAASGGGGGGGGAPAEAPYLLNTDAPVSQLPNATTIRALAMPVDYIWPASSPSGAAAPLRVYTTNVANPPTTGGGVALPFRYKSSSGEQTIAQIGAVWTVVTDPAHPEGALAFALGADETLAMLLTKDKMQFAAPTEITGIKDGTSATSGAAVGQFSGTIATILTGQSSISFYVGPKFNGKPVQVTLASIPGTAIAATPIAFQGVVSGGYCIVSVIDTTNGSLLSGGVLTAIDVAVTIMAV